MSRVVDGNFIFDDEAKQQFLALLRKVEVFSGVEVLTYCLMSNHFHLLLRVPEAPAEISEEEVMRRVKALYGPERVAEDRAFIERMRNQEGSEAAVEAYLAGYRERMYNLAEFMRSLKQRFSRWHNRRYERRGTLWEERFKSVLVEDRWEALMTMALYIELNPVRAGLCEDPKDYRWCGYGAALGGEKKAREGLRRMMVAVLGRSDRGIDALLAAYRVEMMEKGREVKDRAGRVVVRAGFDPETVAKTLREGGRLSRFELLRCRVRYFSDGVVLGSKAFVEDVFEAHMDYFGPKRKDAARPMRGGAWEGLCTSRDLRGETIKPQ
jgi:REP element-mobilizing transposase RayT